MASRRGMPGVILILLGCFLAAAGSGRCLHGAPALSKSSPDEEPPIPIAKVGIQLAPTSAPSRSWRNTLIAR